MSIYFLSLISEVKVFGCGEQIKAKAEHKAANNLESYNVVFLGNNTTYIH